MDIWVLWSRRRRKPFRPPRTDPRRAVHGYAVCASQRGHKVNRDHHNRSLSTISGKSGGPCTNSVSDLKLSRGRRVQPVS